MQLSEETKKAIKEYEEDLKQNNWKNFSSLNEVEDKLKVNTGYSFSQKCSKATKISSNCY